MPGNFPHHFGNHHNTTFSHNISISIKAPWKRSFQVAKPEGVGRNSVFQDHSKESHDLPCKFHQVQCNVSSISCKQKWVLGFANSGVWIWSSPWVLRRNSLVLSTCFNHMFAYHNEAMLNNHITVMLSIWSNHMQSSHGEMNSGNIHKTWVLMFFVCPSLGALGCLCWMTSCDLYNLGDAEWAR